jgi:hypothetical protein
MVVIENGKIRLGLDQTLEEKKSSAFACSVN